MLHKLYMSELEILVKHAHLSTCPEDIVCTHCPQIPVWCSPGLCGFTHNTAPAFPTSPRYQPILLQHDSSRMLIRHLPAKSSLGRLHARNGSLRISLQQSHKSKDSYPTCTRQWPKLHATVYHWARKPVREHTFPRAEPAWLVCLGH